MLAILINSRSTNNLQLPACQRWLNNIGSINATLGTACTDDGVQLVDKENNALITAQKLQDLLHALFKLAAILGACHQHAQLQRKNNLIL